MLSKKLAAGVAVVVGVVVVFLLINMNDVETEVRLGNDPQGNCVVVDKAAEVRIKKNKKLSWKIRNDCQNSNELVTVGNIRTTQASGVAHCREALEGSGVTWPFKEDVADLSERQSRTKIDLHIKTASDLPGSPLTYYYDLCTGANADRKSDPRLVIEN